MGPDSSLGPDLDRGFLELLPLEAKDAADDLKSNQVGVATFWNVWDFLRSGSRDMTSSPSTTTHTADRLKADDL